MNIKEIVIQAAGRWSDLFDMLAIEVGKGQHCACPVCGGKDRFRFDNKEGRGTYICNQCGAGDGLDLVQKFFSCTVREAADKIADCLGLTVNPNNNEQDNPISKKVVYLLSKSRLGQSKYLTKKGLTFDLPLLDNGRIFAPVINASGEYTGGQFIEEDGSKHLMKGSNKKGSFIWVYPKLSNPKDANAKLRGHNEIVICEGVATGISIAEFHHRDAIIVAAVDAGNLIHVARLIREVNSTARIIIAGDNDIDQSPNKGLDKTDLSQNTGLAKAMEAAKAVKGYYCVPNTDYKCDWDDYRQQRGIDKTKEVFNNSIKQMDKPLNIKLEKDGKKPTLSQMAASQRSEVLLDYFDRELALDTASKDVYHYNGITWDVISDMDLMRSMATIFNDANIPYSQNAIRSTVETLKLQLPTMEKQARNLIGFKNGVFDLTTKQFRPHHWQDWLQVASETLFTPGQTDETLQEHAPSFWKWLSYAARGNDKKINCIKAALFMILGNRYHWQLFIEVTGAGGSGKSIFAEIATMLAGPNNTVSASMVALENPRERALIVGKSLVVLPDQTKYVGDAAGLKAITGGDEVSVDPKHKQPYSVRIPAVILAVNNNAMSFSDRSGGISRRRVIFHFGDAIPKDERDPDLKNKIAQELPVIIRHLINEYSDSKKAKTLLEEQLESEEALEIKRNTDSLVDFCGYLLASVQADGLLMGNANILPFNPRKYLYHAYLEFMRGNGLNKPLSLMQFGLSLPACMAEYGKKYMKRKTKTGIRTNLDINHPISDDWLSKIDTPNK
ncbi:hypothetical protein A9G13_07560 [Gilliamella sp. wkB178]|uniref:phage/plasmid primase, P4 family n=1 Tax=Gilliamella sp. wkB178 TaxID=3120259 RepID=UPI00080E6B2F|nr:phage/plasmid primase, P4 family [Gilliamella apicola]OCG08044.1 hypothetical protein A9G13_07560 [Gilliamella apicola]